MNDIRDTDRALREMFKRNAAPFDSRQVHARITRGTRVAPATRHRRIRRVTAALGAVALTVCLSMLGYFALDLVARDPMIHFTDETVTGTTIGNGSTETSVTVPEDNGSFGETESRSSETTSSVETVETTPSSSTSLPSSTTGPTLNSGSSTSATEPETNRGSISQSEAIQIAKDYIRDKSPVPTTADSVPVGETASTKAPTGVLVRSAELIQTSAPGITDGRDMLVWVVKLGGDTAKGEIRATVYISAETGEVLTWLIS